MRRSKPGRCARPGIAGIESCERHRWHADFVGVFRGQETEAEDLEAVRGGGAVQFLTDRADHNLAPEIVRWRGRADASSSSHSSMVMRSRSGAAALPGYGADGADATSSFSPTLRKRMRRNDSAK